jgi:hypothetical protein
MPLMTFIFLILILINILLWKIIYYTIISQCPVSDPNNLCYAPNLFKSQILPDPSLAPLAIKLFLEATHVSPSK